MKLKTILLTIVAAFLFLPSSQAYDVKTLIKKNKKLIKQIKKQHGALVVSPVVSSDSSYYYFLVVNNAKEVGVADQAGNLIVPVKYISVCYFPPVEEGVSNVNCIDPCYTNDKFKPNEFVEVYHKKTDASFFAIKSDGGDFYNLSGTLVSSSKYHSIRSLPGYVFLKDGKYTDCKNLYGVPQFDGKKSLALSPIHSLMIYRSDGTLLYDDIGRIEFMTNDKIKYSKRVDRVYRFGLANVREPEKSIPCYYNKINVDSDKITVQKNLIDTLVTYSPELDKNGITYLDDGERFYNEGDWYSVVNYYKTNGANASWANYISAQACYNIARSKARWIEDAVKEYDADSTKVDIDLKSSLYFTKTFDEAYEYYKLANEHNNDYLAGSDTIYIGHARKLQSLLNKALAEFETQKTKLIKIREKRNNQLEAQRNLEIQNAIKRLEALEKENQLEAQRKAQQLEAQRKAQQLEAQRKAQQQQAVLNILSTITNSISQATYQQSNSNKSSSVSSTTVQHTSNNTATVNNNSVSKPDNSGRKAFLRREIITWNNKIKKAEESYRQAVNSGEDTWQKKRVIESKRKTVEEYLDYRRQLEAELNSLK